MKDKIKTLFTLSASDNINKISSRDYYIIKWIAIITMIIDHIGAFCKISASNTIFFRTVGRIAFPLFCFMLVECFFFTKNKIKHLIKLLIIAIISEIPFNMTHVITFCSKLNLYPFPIIRWYFNINWECRTCCELQKQFNILTFRM